MRKKFEEKPNAYLCENGHITKIDARKLRFSDGMRCPKCGGKENLVWIGVDLGGCDKGCDSNAPKNRTAMQSAPLPEYNRQ